MISLFLNLNLKSNLNSAASESINLRKSFQLFSLTPASFAVNSIELSFLPNFVRQYVAKGMRHVLTILLRRASNALSARMVVNRFLILSPKRSSFALIIPPNIIFSITFSTRLSPAIARPSLYKSFVEEDFD